MVLSVKMLLALMLLALIGSLGSAPAQEVCEEEHCASPAAVGIQSLVQRKRDIATLRGGIHESSVSNAIVEQVAGELKHMEDNLEEQLHRLEEHTEGRLDNLDRKLESIKIDGWPDTSSSPLKHMEESLVVQMHHLEEHTEHTEDKLDNLDRKTAVAYSIDEKCKLHDNGLTIDTATGVIQCAVGRRSVAKQGHEEKTAVAAKSACAQGLEIVEEEFPWPEKHTDAAAGWWDNRGEFHEYGA